jgi:Methyltransferase domain
MIKSLARSVLGGLGYEIRRRRNNDGGVSVVNNGQANHDRLYRYAHLIELFRRKSPRRMIEIGVWRGDRSVQFIQSGPSLEQYVGFDLFDDLSNSLVVSESMGRCTATQFQEVEARLKQAQHGSRPSVELVKGRSDQSLPEFARTHGPEFDFIYIDGGHSIETIQNDWTYSERLLSPDGLAVFDDYYPNDSGRGAKSLIDELLHDDRFVVRFFPMIEDGLEDLQITMVGVTRRTGLARR